MHRVACVVLLVLVVVPGSTLAGATGVVPAGSPTDTTRDNQTNSTNPTQTADTYTTEPEIVAVYPNPVADEDAGEFVAVSVPPGTALGHYAIADDDTTVRLPNTTATGRVVLSTAPNTTAELVDGRVLAVDGLTLANSGEPLQLRTNGTVVDTLTYSNAPEGSLRVRDGQTDWRPLGATDFPVVTSESGRVRAFVLPDSPGAVADHLSDADDRILLGGYTLSSRRVADTLVAASERNVTVRVLVDGAPVGGLTRREARILDRLTRAGVTVRAVGGDYAPYDFHHAKYAVVDDAALVTTENWKPAGTGGASSRGWGLVTDQQPIVAGLVRTFEADAGGRGAIPWQEYRSEIAVTSDNATTGQYPSQFDPSTVPVSRTRLLVAPDNAAETVVGILDNATDTLAIEQVSIGGRESPFLQAALDAARRGVRVRILLSGAWYTRSENRRLVDWLNERADAEGLPLTARLADPRGQFEKIHAKGVVVDGDQVILGSLNWNRNSARDNREVVLVAEGDAVGSYFQRVFEADWPSPDPLPLGTLLAVGVVALVVVLVVRLLRFEDSSSGVTAETNCQESESDLVGQRG